MREPKGEITVDDVEVFLESLGDSGLNYHTTISDDAAEALSKHTGYELRLDGLTEISDKAIESLSRYKGSWLYLCGLTSLTEGAAESLSRYQGCILKLNGLTSISENAAKSLSASPVNHLHLDGLTNLPEEIAASLAGHKGWAIYLNGLTSISDEAAKALSDYQGKFIELNGLSSISDAGARFLSNLKGELKVEELADWLQEKKLDLENESGDTSADTDLRRFVESFNDESKSNNEALSKVSSIFGIVLCLALMIFLLLSGFAGLASGRGEGILGGFILLAGASHLLNLLRKSE